MHRITSHSATFMFYFSFLQIFKTLNKVRLSPFNGRVVIHLYGSLKIYLERSNEVEIFNIFREIKWKEKIGNPQWPPFNELFAFAFCRFVFHFVNISLLTFLKLTIAMFQKSESTIQQNVFFSEILCSSFGIMLVSHACRKSDGTSHGQSQK